jgi:hypothetical protein
MTSLRTWPRHCIVTKTTDGCEYISEFDDYSTAPVRTTVRMPDGREYSWGDENGRLETGWERPLPACHATEGSAFEGCCCPIPTAFD